MEIKNENIYKFKKWNDSKSYKVNKNGYVVRNLNLNPNDAKDLLILNALNNIEDTTMSNYIRKALLQYIENEANNISKEFSEKEIKKFSREDTMKYINGVEFKKSVQKIYSAEIAEIEKKMREEMDEKLKVIYEVLSSLSTTNIDK